MPIVNIPFEEESYQKLSTQQTSIQNFISLLIYKNNDVFPAIERILREYHFNDGGSPYIEGFEITNAEYQPDTRKGRIWLKYRIDYYFGCEDRSAGTTFNEGYNFEIDPDASILKLYFPEPVQRDTLDEF
ncbi:hypothetical protein EOD41_01435 [Mucilaginibacter limnophilus]|uniref:Uncharacterized protein n=1 Tax=Mucilaginibacter limnophilus TaxID=1932778 RepID=A0A3S2Y3G5_9SPHI|nr:hypothetical protein [Mucilaginibacter limnophilus]RVU02630.1 hypothetical protein EOD41_01435 [Mucilaginibacter limnophilus]